MAVTSRQQLIDYCKRELGHPVIEINVDDDQVEDRIDEALQYYQQFHFDATERTFIQHQLTSTDLTNEYISIPDNIIGVTRIFPLNGTDLNSRNMFDVRYQIRLNDIQSLLDAPISYYYITQTHLALIDQILAGQIPIDFNRHTGRLYLRTLWSNFRVGDFIIIECMSILDPDTYTKVYSDRMLKKYATALIKRQWGANLKKFGQVELPGGVVLNGQQIFDEAIQEIEKIEEQIRLEFEMPVNFMVG